MTLELALNLATLLTILAGLIGGFIAYGRKQQRLDDGPEALARDLRVANEQWSRERSEIRCEIEELRDIVTELGKAVAMASVNSARLEEQMKSLFRRIEMLEQRTAARRA